MLVRFAMRWGSGSSASWLQGCKCSALTWGCFGGLCCNPRHRSVLVGMSEAAAAAGRRSRTGLMPVWSLVWFLDTVPASQFRAGRAGEGLNQQWSVCCTSQLPGEMLAQAGAPGCSAWEGTAGAAPSLSCAQGHWAALPAGCQVPPRRAAAVTRAPVSCLAQTQKHGTLGALRPRPCRGMTGVGACILPAHQHLLASSPPLTRRAPRSSLQRRR